MSDDIKITSTQIWQSVAVLFAVLFVGSLWWEAGVDEPPAYLPQKDIFNGFNEEGNFAKGNSDAPVTIYEYSDYQCPFCYDFYQKTSAQVDREYINTGKVRLVYKDFPLSNIHSQAVIAANAARCAGEQEKYWEYHNILFENQRGISEANIKLWAKQLGLNSEQFNECFDERRYQKFVQRDLDEGRALGVTGTPTFFINGEKLIGTQSFSSISRVIEQKLRE